MAKFAFLTSHFSVALTIKCCYQKVWLIKIGPGFSKILSRATPTAKLGMLGPGQNSKYSLIRGGNKRNVLIRGGTSDCVVLERSIKKRQVLPPPPSLPSHLSDCGKDHAPNLNGVLHFRNSKSLYFASVILPTLLEGHHVSIELT